MRDMTKKYEAKTDDIWMTWHFSRRSRNLAEALNLPVYEYTSEGGILKRHLVNALSSFTSLLLHRPRVVYLQYSFLLLIVVIIYKLLLRGRVIVVCDCHTKALRRRLPGKIGQLFWAIKSWSFKHADLSIVSNEGMVSDIEPLTKNFQILPDKIPRISQFIQSEPGNNSCVYVNSFAVDEPHQAVIDAAWGFRNNVQFFFTGKVPESFGENQKLPANVHLTGFLPDKEYFELLRKSGCVLALTSEEDCLQCGAYEALAMGIPMVLSDTSALRTYFASAAIYTKNEANEIRQGVEKALREKERLKIEGYRVRELRDREFTIKLRELTSTVNLLIANRLCQRNICNEQT